MELCILRLIKFENTAFFLIVHYLKMSSRSATYILWTDIQDIIGEASKWPPRIRKLFWTRGLSYFNRFLFTTFCYINGLDLDIIMQWAQRMNLLNDDEAKRHVMQLYRRMEAGIYNDHRMYNYYSYNVTNSRYEYVNGLMK